MEKQSTAYELGRRRAELFLGFSYFLKEHAERQNLETLYFCTREGVFFKAVFDALFGNDDTAIPTPKTKLLEVSRLSSFPPSLLNDQQINYSRLFQLYKSQSPNSLLRSLGQNPSDFENLVRKHGLAPNVMIDNPQSHTPFNALLRDSRIQKKLISELGKQKYAARQYFFQHFGDQQKIGFVEIGWRGTIQNSLATLISNREFHGMYLGLALERNEMRKNCLKRAYGPDHNTSNENVDLLDAINVLEFVCLSNGGSASRYEIRSDGKAIARMEHLEEEDHWIEHFSLPFQQGVLDISREINQEQLAVRHKSGELRKAALDQWRLLLKKPSPALVSAYFSLKSNENFGRGAISDQSIVPSFKTLFLAPFSRKRRTLLVTYFTYSQWAEGMLRRRDLAAPTRIVFYLLAKCALAYKKISHRRVDRSV